MVILGVVLFLLGLVAFLSMAAGNRPDWLSEYFMMLFGAMIAVVICLLAYWWRVTWWYAYAALLLAGVSSYQWFGVPLPLSFIIPGAVVTFSGIIILVRFLQKFPRVSGEIYNESR
jgi:hypothetical protein